MTWAAACRCVIAIALLCDCVKMRFHPPLQPEAKLKVSSAVLIKWAAMLSDLERRSTICRTIYNLQNKSITDSGYSINDYQCPTYTFCCFKAVRPIGWGTRLKLSWLLWVHFLEVIRREAWAGNATGGNHTISSTAASLYLSSGPRSNTRLLTAMLISIKNVFVLLLANWPFANPRLWAAIVQS